MTSTLLDEIPVDVFENILFYCDTTILSSLFGISDYIQYAVTKKIKT